MHIRGGAGDETEAAEAIPLQRIGHGPLVSTSKAICSQTGPAIVIKQR